jgi:hypothetical protein
VVATEQLQWDSFLAEVVLGSDFRNNNTHVEQMRRHIEDFRRTDWPNIQRDLGKPPYNISLAEDLEPHWVAKGRAVYWQENVVRELVEEENGQGTKTRVVKWVSRGWSPTTQGLPANNPDQIARYLKKGFRLRPPSAEGDVEVSNKESAAPSEATPALQIYDCLRHGDKRRGFATWKGYMRHLYHFREEPEYEIPADELKRVQKYPYYCFVHGAGYVSKHTASRHYAQLTSDMQKKHPTVEEMDVTKIITKE